MSFLPNRYRSNCKLCHAGAIRHQKNSRNFRHNIRSGEQSGVNRLFQISLPNQPGKRTGRDVHLLSRQESVSPKLTHNLPDDARPVPTSRHVGLFRLFYQINALKSISSTASLTAGEPIRDTGLLNLNRVRVTVSRVTRYQLLSLSHKAAHVRY